jgi:hypothetical protein
MPHQECIVRRLREGLRGGGKECKAPTHLIKIQNLPMLHALLKIGKTTRYLAKKK